MKLTTFKLSFCLSRIFHGALFAIIATVSHSKRVVVFDPANTEAGSKITVNSFAVLAKPSKNTSQDEMDEPELVAASTSSPDLQSLESLAAIIPDGVVSRVLPQLPNSHPMNTDEPAIKTRCPFSESPHDYGLNHVLTGKISELVFQEQTRPSPPDSIDFAISDSATQRVTSNSGNKVSYPIETRRRGRQGLVLLSFSVSAAGLPMDVRPRRSAAFA